PTAGVTRDRTDRHADDDRQRGRGCRDRERGPGGGCDARPDIATELVGAQRRVRGGAEGGAKRGESVLDVEREWIPGEPRSDDRERDQRECEQRPGGRGGRERRAGTRS